MESGGGWGGGKKAGDLAAVGTGESIRPIKIVLAAVSRGSTPC